MAEARSRHFKDLFTNPVWALVLDALREVERKENVLLQSKAMGGDLAGINTQAGTVQGVILARTRLENMQEEETSIAPADED